VIAERLQCDNGRAIFAAGVSTRPGEAVNEENPTLSRAEDWKPRIEIRFEDDMLARGMGADRPKRSSWKGRWQFKTPRSIHGH
jgi:hypothetical protein